jgi:hypothetical protein
MSCRCHLTPLPTDGAREVGKELTHDAISAGIPFSKPVKEAGSLIYDMAQ